MSVSVAICVLTRLRVVVMGAMLSVIVEAPNVVVCGGGVNVTVDAFCVYLRRS